MEKYFVTVDEQKTIRFYKDEACTILHRVGGPAVVVVDGTKSYWIEGKFHREDGPAIIYADGSKYYYIEDKRHRENGPAVEYVNGYKEYWIHGKEVTEKEFFARNKKDLLTNKMDKVYILTYYTREEQVLGVFSSETSAKKEEARLMALPENNNVRYNIEEYSLKQ